MEPDPDEHVHPGQEDLKWGSGIKDKERRKASAPSARYNKFSEQARRLINGESQCAMFCGGKKCKYCTSDNWKPEQMVIKGLYSEWVTDNILAMARPSNYGFDNLNILDQFVENNIKTVINLQQPGEHASCGYGNDSSGFSYNPQRLMEKHIYFYNFAWAGAIQTSQQVQTVYDFETHLKPFRTIFPSKVSGENEVSFKHFLNRQTHMLHGFEARRLKHIPKVVYLCCERLLELAGHTHVLSKVYRDPPSFPTSAATQPSSPSQTQMHQSFSQLSVHSQTSPSSVSVTRSMRGSVSFEDLPNTKFKKVLAEGDGQGEEDSSSMELNAVEKVFGRDGSTDIGVAGSGSSRERKNEESEEDDDDCIVFGKHDIVVMRGDNVNGQCNDSAVAGLSPDNPSSDAGSDSPRSDQTSQILKSDQLLRVPKPLARFTNTSLDPDTDYSGSNTDPEVKKVGKTKKKRFRERFKGRGKKKEEDKSPEDSLTLKLEGREEDEKSLSSEPGGRSHSGSSGPTILLDGGAASPVTGLDELSQHVCEAMAATEYSAAVRKKADYIEEQLNETDKAWNLLAEEQDPCVLSAVFWDWLDQLKEPVLRRQDLTLLLERNESPRECLHHLEKSVTHFIEYQALVLSKVFPQSEDLETRLAERLLSHLTHHGVVLHLSSFTHNTHQPSHWGEMRSNEAKLLMEFFFRLIDEIAAPRKT